MSAYVVVQRGRYRHSIIGVYSSLETACQQANTCVRHDGEHQATADSKRGDGPDGYHCFEILEFELDDETPCPGGMYHRDGRLVATVSAKRRGRWIPGGLDDDGQREYSWVPPSGITVA